MVKFITGAMIGFVIALWANSIVTERQRVDLMASARKVVIKGVAAGYQCRISGRTLEDCKHRAELAMDGVVQ